MSGGRITRWTARRKAAIVDQVRKGQMTVDEALALYSLSLEEFSAWQRALERYGTPGLRVTRIQVYKECEQGAPRRAKPRNYHACAHS